jgi:hypothetical protein
MSLFLRFFKLPFTYRTLLSIENECCGDMELSPLVVTGNGAQVALGTI